MDHIAAIFDEKIVEAGGSFRNDRSLISMKKFIEALMILQNLSH